MLFVLLDILKIHDLVPFDWESVVAISLMKLHY